MTWMFVGIVVVLLDFYLSSPEVKETRKKKFNDDRLMGALGLIGSAFIWPVSIPPIYQKLKTRCDRDD